MNARAFASIAAGAGLRAWHGLALLVAALCILAAPARAQNYPDKVIRLVTPFPPGGGTDALARIIAQKMSERVHQQVIVDSRPGAGGNIATDLVVRAPKDGYVLLVGINTALTVNPSLYSNSPFDIERDLVPIFLFGDSQYILVVNPKLPVTSVKDLIDYAAANPGKLNYSSGGVGSPLHLAAALFMLDTGVDIVHLPFRGGAPAALAVMGGDAQILFGSFAATLPNIQAGNLRALALTGLRRSAMLPGIPTLNESALPGFEVTSWHGLMAPAGTPKPILDRLGQEMEQILADPDVLRNMEREGLGGLKGGPAALTERIKTETASWAKVIKDANIKME